MKKLLYVIKVFGERGPGFFWTYFSQSVWFDLRHGTKTFARVPKDEQTIESSDTEADNGLLYVASFTDVTLDTVKIAREALGTERFAKSQFFDLGCGKGKALLVFVKYFGAEQKHPAIGIEYDPDLVELAKRNMDKCSFTKGKVEVHADSAVNLLQYASADTLIVYLYNSFQGETLRATLTSLKDTPHVLIYVDPADKVTFGEFDYTIIKENSGRYNADTWLVATSGLEQGATP